ncbi:MAG: DUF2007 domain-containing protein [Tannerella sp.]|jgi:hypothetical protein|nr:DUF2007 domain-containing protein [Tannerella sp.]
MDRIIEIANFQQPEKAELLASLLRSEGIECFMPNEVSSHVLRGYLDVGARVEIFEKDLTLALDVMKNAGYSLPGENMETEDEENDTALARRVPILKNLSFEKQIVIIIGLILGILALLIYLQSYFSAENI